MDENITVLRGRESGLVSMGEENKILVLCSNILLYQSHLIVWTILIRLQNTRTAPRQIGLVCWVLWHINLCGLFNAKSIFM